MNIVFKLSNYPPSIIYDIHTIYETNGSVIMFIDNEGSVKEAINTKLLEYMYIAVDEQEASDE